MVMWFLIMINLNAAAFSCVGLLHTPCLLPFFVCFVTPGANKYGQLGRGDKYDTGDDPDEMGNNLIKVNLGSGEVAVDIALAEEHSCVVLKSGGTKVRARGEPTNLLLGERHLFDGGLGLLVPSIIREWRCFHKLGQPHPINVARFEILFLPNGIGDRVDNG